MDGQAAARQVDRGARHSSAFDALVRSGLVAYGFVHLLIAGIAIELVLGGSSGKATGKGALAALAADTVGRVVLGVLALAFAALAAWQAVAGAVGYRDRDGWSRHLQRFAAGTRVVAYGYLAMVSGRLALEGRAGQGKTPDQTTASVMALPGGRWIVAAAGLIAAGTGIGLFIFGLRKGFVDQLDREARSKDRRVPIVLVGQVGYVAKGVAFVIIGALLCWAAATANPNRSGGLDEALHEFLGYRLGGPAVILAGIGIGCFGLFLLARSRHLNPKTLTA